MPVCHVLVFLAMLVTGLFAPLVAAESSRPTATLLTIDGPIGPATADYVRRGIDKAAKADAAIVILKLNTPGGLVTAMREIAEAIFASPIPVVAYVAPAGAHAASAGTYLVYAANIAAMAPGTSLGAATPVAIGGTTAPDETGGKRPAIADKAMNDAIASIRSWAELRGRNADWAEKAVREAATLTAEQALKEKVIDLIAADVPDLLRKLDGWRVETGGESHALSTAHLTVEPAAPDWRVRFLAIITDPNIAAILMLIGVYGLLFEFYSPGLVGPGVIGGICLLLALYAFHLLPIDYTGLALLLLGIALMIAEAFIPSFGIIGLGGLAAFVLGTVMLFDTDVPGFTVAWELVGGVALVTAATATLVMTMVLRSRRRAIVSGPEQMLGSTGRVIAWRGNKGDIWAHGERWSATAQRPLRAGACVRIVRIDGLTLVVEPNPEEKDKR